MSVPVGFGEGGRPVGMQLIGDYFAESRLLGVAHRVVDGFLDHAKRHDRGRRRQPAGVVVGLDRHGDSGARGLRLGIAPVDFERKRSISTAIIQGEELVRDQL